MGSLDDIPHAAGAIIAIDEGTTPWPDLLIRSSKGFEKTG